MKFQFRNFLQFILVLVVVFIFVRLFPLVLRLAEGGALVVREFWWLVLIFGIGGWAIWMLRKSKK